MTTVDDAANERFDSGRQAARGARQLAAAVALGLALWLAAGVVLARLAL